MQDREQDLMELGQRVMLGLISENEQPFRDGKGSPAAFADVSGKAWQAQFGWRHRAKREFCR